MISKLNKDEKLNGDNYEICHHKVWYILKEQKTLETLNYVMQELE